MNKIYDCIIVGAGPAGLSASIYLKRANKDVLVIESVAPGGKLLKINKLENYPGIVSDGFTIALNMFNQATSLGVEFKYEKFNNFVYLEKENLYSIKTNNDEYYSKYLILAIGSINATKSERPYLDKFLGKGLSHCVTCDGALYKGKTVLLEDNTEEYLDNINYLKNIVNELYVVSDKDLSNVDKINVINSTIINASGNENIEKVYFKDGQELNIDGIFVEDETTDISSFIKNKSIEINEYYETNSNGFYAIGDMTNKLKQVVTAASSGAIAATDIIKKLNRNK